MDALQAIHDQLDEYLRKPGDPETALSTFIDTPQDILLTNAVVSKRNDQLSALASQMANINNVIVKLTAIRTRLQENSAHVRQSLLAHQALTTASRRIPPEVWGEVFYHCQPKTPYIIPKNLHPPMVLTRVCRDWHLVAISTPRLWSSLTIYLQKFVRGGYYRHGCETWSARAKNIPLSIHVFNDMIDCEDPVLVSSAVHWLRPFITRCSDLWWHGPSLPTLFIQETGTEIDLPLECLRITTRLDSPSIYFPGPASHLHSASIQSLNHDAQSLDEIRLPWDHLIKLDIHFALFSSTLYIQLLAHCHRLHTLIVSCLSADEIQLDALRALALGSIIHPNLRCIEIKVIRAGLDAILNAVTLPALEELDICFCYRKREVWPHAPFMEMVRRSRCTLKRLTVRSNRNAVLHFGEYMEAMPGLAVFTSDS